MTGEPDGDFAGSASNVNRGARPLLRFGLLALVVLLVLFAGVWAGRVTMAPPVDPLADNSQPASYEVVEQTIGRSLRFSAEAHWPRTPLARAWSSGVVTSIDFEPGAEVDVGDVLFTVDLRPVAIAQGAVPAFRDLAIGAAGDDVEQLQAMLGHLGFLQEKPDGQFGPGTDTAVRAWQESHDMSTDGIVRQSDIAFAPTLPVRIAPTDALAVGAVLTTGEVVIDSLAATPTISVALSIDQRELVPLSGSVTLTYPEGEWAGVIARAEERSDQGVETLVLVIEGQSGGAACGEVCAEWIAPIGTTDFPADIVVIPETTGPVVPVAAIVTGPGGETSVVMEGGRDAPVRVIQSTDALAVVDGVEAGDVILLPFTQPNDD